MLERVSPRVTSSATEVACGLVQTEQGRPRWEMRYLITANARISVDPERNCRGGVAWGGGDGPYPPPSDSAFALSSASAPAPRQGKPGDRRPQCVTFGSL